jgi:predicted DNA-binding transcriptional regulator AlpA
VIDKSSVRSHAVAGDSSSPVLLKFVQMAKFLGVSRKTLKSWCDAGLLPQPLTIQGKFYFRASEVRKAVEKLGRPQSPEQADSVA